MAEVLRYGLVGGGFVSAFHLRALEMVRGVDVVGIASRSRPEALAAGARQAGLGDVRVYGRVEDLARDVDVVAVFSPNFTRVAVMEAVARAARDGARLRGLIVEKPLARNLAEARRVLELAREIGAPTAYFENQIHMKMLQTARRQLGEVAQRMGPLTLVRAAEEHGGPHAAWFWDPTLQGGGVLSDMGCHSLAVGRYLLTPAGSALDFLEPRTVSCDLGLLKWGQPRWRDELRARHGVDYAQTPAEDFATGIVTYRNSELGQDVKAQFTVSWMYDKQGLRLLVDGLGAGYALEANSLRSPLEVFVGDEAVGAVSDAELGLEKATASRGLLAIQPNEPDLYGYTDENVDAAAAFRDGRSALLDLDDGYEVVRLTMAAYLSAEEGRVVDLTDDVTRARLDNYVPLIQQGRGTEVLARPI